MTDNKPSFAVFGSGGVGGYFGACLARAGYATTFIARGEHLQAMRRSGLQIESPQEQFAITPCVATDQPEAVGPVNFVLFTVKLWDTRVAGAACLPLLGPDTAVVSFQNGVDSEQVLSEVLGREAVMGGVAEISATLAGPGRVQRFSPFARLRVGELDGNATPRAQQLVTALEQAGVEVSMEADIQRAVWKKFMFLTGLSAITALTRKSIGPLREDADTRGLLIDIMTEVLRVAQAQKIPLSEADLQAYLKFIDTLPVQMRASMAVDLERGNRLELDGLSGAVVRLGGQSGIAVPANRFVCTALKLSAGGGC